MLGIEFQQRTLVGLTDPAICDDPGYQSVWHDIECRIGTLVAFRGYPDFYRLTVIQCPRDEENFFSGPFFDMDVFSTVSTRPINGRRWNGCIERDAIVMGGQCV